MSSQRPTQIIFFFVLGFASTNLLAQEPVVIPRRSNPNIIESVKPAEIKTKEAPPGQQEERKTRRKANVQEEEVFAPPIDQSVLMNEVIQGQLEALRSFDPSKAYYAYTSSDFQKTIPLDSFKDYVKANKVLYSNKSFVIDNVNFAGIVAIVSGVIIGADGKSMPIEFDLVLENGQWKVRKINLLGQYKK